MRGLRENGGGMNSRRRAVAALVTVLLTALFVLGPAFLAPVAIAVGPSALSMFAAGCFVLAALPRTRRGRPPMTGP